MKEIAKVLGELACQDVHDIKGKRRSRQGSVGSRTLQECIIGLLDVLEPVLVVQVVKVPKHGPNKIMLGRFEGLEGIRRIQM